MTDNQKAKFQLYRGSLNMTDNQKAKFDELYYSMDYLRPILRQSCNSHVSAGDAYHGIILAMAKKSSK